MIRCASDSRLEQRRLGMEGVVDADCPGPSGSATVLTSYTEFSGPSTIMSSRTLKKCWWIGPYTCGATSSPHCGSSPGRVGAVGDDAGHLDLSSIVPSW